MFRMRTAHFLSVCLATLILIWGCGPEPGACPEGLEPCGSSCADTEEDPNHCGGCGLVCEEGRGCTDGECSGCVLPYEACGGVCVDTSSSNTHCGGCDLPCRIEDGFECRQGECSCIGELTNCEGVCVDTSSREEYCGSCDISCSANETCCGGHCIDTNTSPEHCGDCRSPCDPSLTCCGGACIDTNADPRNCGACNNACDETSICCNGDCVSSVGDIGPPLISEGPCGLLIYGRYANEGQTNTDHILPDFSFAGYGGGGAAIPTAPVHQTLHPAPGDDRQRIQAALDAVGALEPDAQGLRGAVLLTAGDYEAGDTLWIRNSGVVLRGEGQGEDGTILTATKGEQHDFVAIQGEGTGFGEVQESRVNIVDTYVPVGSRNLTLASASHFSVGDWIVVLRTPNQTWIDDLQMGQYGWTASGYAVPHERRITAIQGDRITIDVPIIDTMEEQYGGGVVYLSNPQGRISQCGVEYIRLVSAHSGGDDENHGWKGVRLRRATDSWVRGVTAVHFGYSAVSIESDSRNNTVEDSAMLDPISIVTGGRRYSFNVSGSSSRNLFQRCYSRGGRHNFVTGSRVPGPNVWLDSLAVDSRSDDGPHHRWAAGLLFDNIDSREATSSGSSVGDLNVQNRATSGTGHGWAGAQTLFWNSRANRIRCDAPLGAMNWAIGCIGTKTHGSWVPSEPFGWWESHGEPVAPRSLYLRQLEERLGAAAVERITIPAQLRGGIHALLGDWAGQGPNFDYGPDPDCERGIRSGNTCCAASCGSCGGEGCGQRPGGAASCCTSNIAESGRLCSEVGPPCVM